MTHTAECSYQIVMSTEIIGLSHREREIIANAIRFDTEEFVSFEEFSMGSSLDKNDYLLIAKISAILRWPIPWIAATSRNSRMSA